jgi:hypothetical protein
MSNIIRRTWTNPIINSFQGPDARTTRSVFESLTEYLRTHIGIWGEATGTTDANGEIVVVHNGGFQPTSVLVTEVDLGNNPPHTLGPFHLHDVTETEFTLHFLEPNGQDRASHNIKVFYQCLPSTRILN